MDEVNHKLISKLQLDGRTTLKELGELLDPPVGKSGVNHRLKKLSEIANQMREQRGGLTK